jgi:hypothetical protein
MQIHSSLPMTSPYYGDQHTHTIAVYLPEWGVQLFVYFLQYLKVNFIIIGVRIKSNKNWPDKYWYWPDSAWSFPTVDIYKSASKLDYPDPSYLTSAWLVRYRPRIFSSKINIIVSSTLLL